MNYWSLSFVLASWWRLTETSPSVSWAAEVAEKLVEIILLVFLRLQRESVWNTSTALVTDKRESSSDVLLQRVSVIRLQDSLQPAPTGPLGSSEAGSLSAATVARSSSGGRESPCGRDTSPSDGFTWVQLLERLSPADDWARDQSPELTVSAGLSPVITLSPPQGRRTAEPS